MNYSTLFVILAAVLALLLIITSPKVDSRQKYHLPIFRRFFPYLAQIDFLWSTFERSSNELLRAMLLVSGQNSDTSSITSSRKETQLLLKLAQSVFHSNPSLHSYLGYIAYKAVSLRDRYDSLFDGRIPQALDSEPHHVTIEVDGHGQMRRYKLRMTELDDLFNDLSILVGEMTLLINPEQPSELLAAKDFDAVKRFWSKVRALESTS